MKKNEKLKDTLVFEDKVKRLDRLRRDADNRFLCEDFHSKADVLAVGSGEKRPWQVYAGERIVEARRIAKINRDKDLEGK